jgi:hypothetical protein
MWAILTIGLVALLGLSSLAYADDGNDAASGAQPASDAQSAPATQPDSATQSDPATQAVTESETPRSIRPYELGWALTNLFATVLTLAIGVVMVIQTMLRRQNNTNAMSGGVGLTAFSAASAALSTVLFTSTEDLSARMIVADSFTVVHIALLAVAVLCAVLSMRRDARRSTLE